MLWSCCVQCPCFWFLRKTALCSSWFFVCKIAYAKVFSFGQIFLLGRIFSYQISVKLLWVSVELFKCLLYQGTLHLKFRFVSPYLLSFNHFIIFVSDEHFFGCAVSCSSTRIMCCELTMPLYDLISRSVGFNNSLAWWYRQLVYICCNEVDLTSSTILWRQFLVSST